MEATVIKLKGNIQNAKAIADGLMFTNPTQGSYSCILRLVARTPGLSDGAIRVILRAYDGELGTSSSTWTPIKTEIIDGVVVRTYDVTLSSGSWEYVDDNDDHYIGRGIWQKGTPPKRIDVISDEVDFYMMGDNASNYDDPICIDASQIKYSTIPESGKIVQLTHGVGTVKTEWFRDNNTLIRFSVVGENCDIQGTIMDFVNAGATLQYINLLRHEAVRGDLREYFDALTAAGVKNHDIELRISSTGITNDITPEYSPVYVHFNSSGVWTASNSNA